MRPERIIVGEGRGAEALDMLQAMNTGQDGSILTGTATRPEICFHVLKLCVSGSAMPFGSDKAADFFGCRM